MSRALPAQFWAAQVPRTIQSRTAAALPALGIRDLGQSPGAAPKQEERARVEGLGAHGLQHELHHLHCTDVGGF